MPKSKDDNRRRYIAEPLARAEVLQRPSSHFDFARTSLPPMKNRPIAVGDAIGRP